MWWNGCAAPNPGGRKGIGANARLRKKEKGNAKGFSGAPLPNTIVISKVGLKKEKYCPYTPNF